MKKLEEWEDPPKRFTDVNSPECQEFLRNLQKEIKEAGKKFREECEKLRIKNEGQRFS